MTDRTTEAVNKPQTLMAHSIEHVRRGALVLALVLVACVLGIGTSAQARTVISRPHLLALRASPLVAPLTENEGYEVHGVVSGAGGKPLVDVGVLLEGAGGSASTSTGEAGSYSFNVPAGVYRLHTLGAIHVLGGRAGGAAAEIASLNITQNTAENIEFARIPVGTLTATVIDANGTPVPHLEVDAASLDEQRYESENTQGTTVTYSGGETYSGEEFAASTKCETNTHGECTFQAFAGAQVRVETHQEGELSGRATATATIPGGVATVLLPVAIVPSAGSVPGSVEVEVPDGATLSGFGSEAAIGVGLPSGGIAVVGSVRYRVSGLAAGASLNVHIRLPEGSEPTAVYKHVDGEYVNMAALATISANRITLHLTDGGLGDEDGEANGVVVDPLVPVRVEPPGPAPTVTKLSTKSGPAAGGSPVTITGTNLRAATAVKFGATAAPGFKVLSPSAISVDAPPSTAGTVNVTVTSTNGTSQADSKTQFKYADPTITDVSPDTEPTVIGIHVTVAGSGFAIGDADTTFKFGKAYATDIACANTGECTMVAPAGKAGTIDVIAAVGKLKSKKTAADHYTYG